MPRSLLLVFFLAGAPASSEWPQWRGPARDGVATTPAPSSWPQQLAETWRVSVGSGHSSPVADGRHVYSFAREGDREVVRALDLDDGKIVWERAYEAPYTMNPAATSHGKGPKSTPLLAGERLFTLGIEGMLSCWDRATGELVWNSDFADRFPVKSPLYGTAMSPILAGGKLIVHLGGPGQGALLALDPETGKPIWSTEGDGPGYASPVLATLGEVEQIVTQTDAHILGVALESGKLLWSLPFTTPYDQNIVTPILQAGALILGGLESETFALELPRGSGGLEPRRIWTSPYSFYMSTPVLVGDRLVGLSNKRRGQFVALDAKTGETLWESEGRRADNASLVLWGEWILALTDGGELFVLPSEAKDFTPLRTYSVASSPTYAHLVPTVDGVLVKDESSLALFGFEP